MASFAVILPAAGKSSRFRDPFFKKPFAPLEGRAVWVHTAERFVHRPDVVQTILVISPEDREEFSEKFGAHAALLGVELVDGGTERADSVLRAIEKVRPEADYIAVHDAARPCVTERAIDEVFAAAVKVGAAILAAPVTATLKRSTSDQRIDATVSREMLFEAQTPQVFRRALLEQAYARRDPQLPSTDDAQLVERLGHPIKLVNGASTNLKITTQDDLRLAAAILKSAGKSPSSVAPHPFAGDSLWR